MVVDRTGLGDLVLVDLGRTEVVHRIGPVEVAGHILQGRLVERRTVAVGRIGVAGRTDPVEDRHNHLEDHLPC